MPFKLVSALMCATLVSAVLSQTVETPDRAREPRGAAVNTPETSLDVAREASWTGEYERALEAYRAWMEVPSSRITAAVGIGRTARITGQYDEALEALVAVEFDAAADPEWIHAMVELQHELGHTEEALKYAQRGLRLDPGDSTARRWVGRLLEESGRRNEAIEVYAWFDALLKRGYPAGAEILTNSAIGIYRHAILSRRRDASQRTRYVLHELLQPVYERVDKTYWPARLVAADLLLSKYNLHDAASDYTAALEINPNLVEAHVGLGRIALEGWKFEEADERLAKARAINDKSPLAHRFAAELHLQERKFAEAAKSARRALETNAKDLEAYGLLAAALWREYKVDEAREAYARADAINAQSPLAPYTLGSWLSAGRQFDDAESYLQEAIRREPIWANPQTALGLMYMQSGEERAARRVLETSWRLDSYNVETKHTLDLLDDLDRFTRDETAHFIIKSVEDPDAAVRSYYADYIESIYEEICDRYGGEPEKKTIVEIFPEHQSFAIRITAKPWLHTIGASTGRVIAIDAPRVEAASRSYNWARVLRHEFVHTVTLDATDNRIPHWLTEGLAVLSEEHPRPWEWCLLLAAAWRSDRLFELDTIDWGFARPQRPTDRTLAYAQSEWMVEYLAERQGERVIQVMLDRFREGIAPELVIAELTEQSPKAFIAGFEDWAAGQMSAWGLDVQRWPTAEALKQQASSTKGEEAAIALARLGAMQMEDGDIPEAQEFLAEALEAATDPIRDVLRLELQLRLIGAWPKEREGDTKPADVIEEICATAERLKDLEPEDPWAWKALVQVARMEEKPAEVRAALERLVDIWPRDRASLEALAGLYLDEGDDAKAFPILMRSVEQGTDEADIPFNLGRIHEERGETEEAVHWYEQTIQIDPYRRDVHERLGAHYTELERHDEAVREYRVLTQLKGTEADYHCQLAMALHRAGDTEEAEKVARRAVRLDPDCEVGEWLSDNGQ